MNISRRRFLTVAAAAGGSIVAAPSRALSGARPPAREYGCLVDLALCDGCRKCELACNQANALPPPDRPFDDLSVVERPRRPTDRALTIVNKVAVAGREKPVYVKVQCMHCNDPACVSACIVGALTKEPNGAVVYDKSRCLGCRYCMVACPFQVPAYEYRDPLTPRVTKCNFCFERVSKEGGVPACAKMCPKEAIEFGPRADVLSLARERISNPGTRHRKHGPHVPAIYGEHEVGGTAWMYISPVPFAQLGFLALPAEAPPRLTEAIQHGIFNGFIFPAAAYSLLGLVMYMFRDRSDRKENGGGKGSGSR
ncbi:MAG: 4Fe-4S dicluster domain-containing protein [Deltaproteobacteria bacterium]|nr:4Fe-4S dicluster domain-containing protein [Deltaproteobacteria bacterium]